MLLTLTIHIVLSTVFYFLFKKANRFFISDLNPFLFGYLGMVFNILVLIVIPVSIGEIMRGVMFKYSNQSWVIIFVPHILFCSYNLYDMFKNVSEIPRWFILKQSVTYIKWFF